MGRVFGHLQVAAGFLGAVIGAGFASGQELMQFFVSFNSWGTRGGVLAGLLLAILGALVLHRAQTLKVRDYRGLWQALLGPALGRVVDLLLAVFLFSGLVVMLAGSGALFQEQLHLRPEVGIGLTVVIVAGALLTGERGFLNLNSLLVPVLLGITLWVALGSLRQSYVSVATPVLLGGRWWWAALLYASYNLILASVVLASLAPSLPPGAWRGGALGGILLGLMAVLLIEALRQNPTIVAGKELPLLSLAGGLGRNWQVLYAVAMWCALLTTAVANVYGLAVRLTRWAGGFRRAEGLVLGLALPFSGLGFKEVVGTLYPFMGWLGLLLVGAVVAGGHWRWRRI